MAFSDVIGIAEYVPNEYARAVVVFVLLLVVFRVLLLIFSKLFLKLASKTKTDADDIFVQRSSTPLTFLALLISIRVAIHEIGLGDTLILNLERAIHSGIVIAIGYIIYLMVQLFLIAGWSKVSSRSKIKVDQTLSSVFHNFLRVTLILLAFIYILNIWGVEVLPLIGALGVAGIAVALALQPTLSNIFSGISMILDKSVRVGDWVVLDSTTTGVIQKIGIRSTQVKSFDNEVHIVPNTKLADSVIQNVSLPDPRARVVINFGVAYGSDVDKVRELVLKEIKKITNVVEDPEPFVRFIAMADSSLNFKAYFHVKSFEDRFSAIDEANTRIYKALNKAGISIPFPQMDVHIKQDKK